MAREQSSKSPSSLQNQESLRSSKKPVAPGKRPATSALQASPAGSRPAPSSSPASPASSPAPSLASGPAVSPAAWDAAIRPDLTANVQRQGDGLVPFSGQGHRLGGDLTLEESRSRLPGDGPLRDGPAVSEASADPGSGFMPFSGEGHRLGGELTHEQWREQLPGPDAEAELLILDYLSALVDQVVENENENDGEGAEQPAQPEVQNDEIAEPENAENADDAEIQMIVHDLVTEAVERALTEHLRREDPVIEQRVEQELSQSGSGDPAGVPAPAPQITPPTIDNSGFGSQAADTVGAVSDLAGNMGTHFGNNMGAQTDPLVGGAIEGWFGDTTDAALSGNGDIAGAIAQGAGLVIQVQEALAVLRSDDATAGEKAKASVDIAGAATGFVQTGGVLMGGITYQAEAIGGASTSTNVGFTADGGNMLSTDAKLVGDAAGVLTSLLGVVGDAIDAMNKIASGEMTKGTRVEVAGRVGLTIGKAVKDLGGVAKTIGQLVGQIQGGGQIAADFGGAGFKTYVGQALPGIGAGIAAANITRQSYNVHKFRGRRKQLKEVMQRQALSEAQQETIAFADSVLKKRITRAGLDIGLDSAALVGNVIQAATPVGTAAGLTIGATTGVVRLGVVGTRTAKQGLRNRKARRREAHGKDDTYAEWKARKKQQGSLKSRMAVMFTANWDKSSKAKAATYLHHALEIVQMNDEVVYASIGLDRAAIAEMDAQGQVDAIIAALRKR